MHPTTQAAASQPKPARRGRWISALLAAPLAALAAAHWVAPDGALLLIWLGGLTPWLFLPAYALLAYALSQRDVAVGALAAIAVLSHLAWVGPTLAASSTPSGPSARESTTSPLRLRLATANLLAVNETPEALLEELLTLDADVLVLQEVSFSWADWLRDPRVRRRYPHSRLEARPDAFGVAILSRHPIVGEAIASLEDVPLVDAVVDVDGVAVRVLGVHTLPPIDGRYASVWRAQFRALERRLAGHAGPLVVAGDLNSTSFSGSLARLRRAAGLRDVHDSLGRGLTTTWPNGVFFAPSMRLDHVLVNDAWAALDVREGAGPGSDHRPIVVELALLEVGRPLSATSGRCYQGARACPRPRSPASARAARGERAGAADDRVERPGRVRRRR